LKLYDRWCRRPIRPGMKAGLPEKEKARFATITASCTSALMIAFLGRGDVGRGEKKKRPITDRNAEKNRTEPPRRVGRDTVRCRRGRQLFRARSTAEPGG